MAAEPSSAVRQMDRMGANFFRTVDMIVSNLAAKPLVLTLPIGAEDNFQASNRSRGPRGCLWTVMQDST